MKVGIGLECLMVNQTPTNEIPDCSKEDHLRWTPNSYGIFSIRSAWHVVRSHDQVVNWYGIRLYSFP